MIRPVQNWNWYTGVFRIGQIIRRHTRRSSERGGAAAEVSVTLGVFLFIVILFCACALHLYRLVGLQFAVNETARWASIGRVAFSSNNRRVSSFSSYTSAEVQQRLIASAQGYGVSISHTDVIFESVCGAGEVGCVVAALPSVPSNKGYRLAVRKPVAQFYGLVNLRLNADAVGYGE